MLCRVPAVTRLHVVMALIPEATVVASSSRAIAVVLDAWLRLTLNQHTRNIKEVKKWTIKNFIVTILKNMK